MAGKTDPDAFWRQLDRFILFADSRTPLASDGSDDGMPLWRRRVFYTSFLTATMLGFFSYLPTLTTAYSEGMWLPAVGYSLFYLVSLGLVFVPGIPFFWRLAFGLSIIYLVGLLNLNLAGLLGSGRIWLFFFSVISCVLLGIRFGLASFALNMVTLGAFYLFLDQRAPAWDALLASHGYNTAWLLTGNTFLVLNLVAVLSAALLVKGLEHSLRQALNLHGDLETKNRRVQDINRVLRNEVAERRRAEGALLASTKELEETNLRLLAQINERIRAEQRLHELNRCLLGFGPDPGENINRLTELCGRMLAGSWAIYSRLEGEKLEQVGSWNMPPGFKWPENPEGAACWDVIRLGAGPPLVVPGMQKTKYAQTDPNIIHLGVNTYVGCPVMVRGSAMGSLCVVYTQDIEPTPGDLEFMATVATALAVEELRWRSELSLRESEARMEAMLNTVDTGIVLIDAESHCIVNLNPAAAAAIGAGQEKIIGRVCHEFICEAPVGQCPLTDQGETLDKEVRVLITASGERRDILKSATTIELGGKLHLLESFVDITDRNRAEESLRRSEEKYRSILEDMEDAYFELDLKGSLLFFNDSACRILGYARQEIEGLKLRDYLEPGQEKQLEETTNELLNAGRISKDTEWRVRTKDGEICYLKSSGTLLRDEDGQPIGYRGVAQDVTEIKKSERLYQEKLTAELASQAKTQFLANMSHEIRTPINGIIGMSELVKDTGLNEDQRRYVDVIHSEANSLLAIVNEILDLSKMEAGRMDLEQISFDLRVTMEDLADSLAHRAARRGLDFSSFVSPDIPPRLLGDPTRLRQIINNLAVNALKFTPSGDISVRAQLEGEPGDKARVRFEVEDSGVGIPPEKLPTIFESFTQADASTTRKYGGTGLGTTISKQLVELMGGKIGVESQPGKGSTFWAVIDFPVHKQDDMKEHLANLDIAGRKVLVVDDRAKERLILNAYLSSWGCSIIEASSGSKALALLEQARTSREMPDLILVDTSMPAMDGFQLAGLIKEGDLAPGVPIIAMSSTASVGEGRRCRQIGIEGYLTKPVKRGDLHRVIMIVLGLASMPDTPQDTLVTRHTAAEVYGRPRSVLVAEDYPTNQQVVANHLKQAGLEYQIASDGEQAVEAFKNGHFDLVLMDIQMPRMDGYQATRLIREFEAQRPQESGEGSDGPPPRVPIVALTAHAMKGFRDQCLAAGMDDYATKPFRKSDLLAVLQRWLPDTLEHQPGAVPAKPAVREEAVDQEDRPMDYTRAVDEFEGDEDLVREVLDSFLETAQGQMREMEDALEQGYLKIITRHAHSIKGGAANLIADRLSLAAAALEYAAKSEELEKLPGLIKDLEQELAALQSYMAGLEEPM